MKKVELEEAIKALEAIKAFGDKQSFNVTTLINTNVIKIMPVLKAELERMETDKVAINCPAMKLVEQTTEENLIDTLNKKMQELVLNDYRIIDFGLFKDTTGLTGYIKYTS